MIDFLEYMILYYSLGLRSYELNCSTLRIILGTQPSSPITLPMTNPLHTTFWYFSSLLAMSARGRESATSSIRLWYTDCLYFLAYLQRFRAGECSDDNPDWHESADSSETQKVQSLANIQQVITMITRRVAVYRP